MRSRQFGLSILGLLAAGVVIIVVALLGMKLAPSYIEYFAVKKAVIALGEEQRNGASPTAIRKNFDNRATIDSISSISGADLEVTKEHVAVAYRKEVPLAGNVGVYIDFSAASKGE